MNARWRRLRGDDGFTLPELIIVGIITTLVLVAVGGMYISTLRAERIVNDLSETTTSAQLVARSIDNGVRNGVELTPVAVAPNSGQMFAVCTAGAGEAVEYVWRAWYFGTSGDGEVRTRDFPSDAKPVSPSSADLATWTLLLTGVAPRSGSTSVFTVDGPSQNVATVAFDTKGGRTDTASATIEFAAHLAPHPTYAPGSEPCT